MPEWYEDDEFWESFAPFFFTPERVDSSGAQADGLIKLLGGAPYDNRAERLVAVAKK